MKLWMKKIAAVLMTVVTLGFYIPPVHMDAEAEENKDPIPQKADTQAPDTTEQLNRQRLQAMPRDVIDDSNQAIAYRTSHDQLVTDITEQAKTQTMTKFGPRIAKQLEDDFTATILPNMERVLDNVVTDDQNVTSSLAISEGPSPGLGERIFHVCDDLNDRDVAHFHVRREHRPMEGHWFTFHYHLSNDNFEKHHEIGELYWDKNEPPKWMA